MHFSAIGGGGGTGGGPVGATATAAAGAFEIGGAGAGFGLNRNRLRSARFGCGRSASSESKCTSGALVAPPDGRRPEAADPRAPCRLDVPPAVADVSDHAR